jgi:hypothetical protein
MISDCCRSNRLALPQQLWQPRDVDGDAPRLIAREPAHSHAPAGLVLVIDLGERLTLGVANAEAFGGRVIDAPWGGE